MRMKSARWSRGCWRLSDTDTPPLPTTRNGRGAITITTWGREEQRIKRTFRNGPDILRNMAIDLIKEGS